MRRSQWLRGLRCRSAAARLLRYWVWIPPGEWMFNCCECCMLSGKGLCDELITRPEESYRLWCVFVCDLETSRMRRPWTALGRSATGEENKYIYRRPAGTGRHCSLSTRVSLYTATLLVDSKQTGLESDEAVWEYLNKEIERSTIANERGKLISFLPETWN